MILSDTIRELKDTFHSIDIRIFSYKHENIWKNIFTVIRFRRETENELSIIHEELIKKCRSLIETDEFKVNIAHFPVEQWDKISSDLGKKFICLNDTFAVNYDNPVTFNGIVNEPHPKHEDYVYKNWKFFSGHSETGKTLGSNYHDELRNIALKNQFSHVDDYLSAIFQYDKYDFQRSPWVNTYVPVFFKVENIEFDHDKVTIDYTAYEQKNIELTFNFFKSQMHRSNEEFVNKESQKLKLKNGTNLIQDNTTIELDTKNAGNSFELLIIKNEDTLIGTKEGNINDFWKGRTEYTNPLYFIFEKFVKYDELEKMLIQFKSKKITNDSEVFERGVSWLLNLLGISNIMLSEYEKIGKGSEKISTDILASMNKNKLLLVNVTVGLPKQSDFDREREYRVNIEKLLTNKNLKIFSIYFTGKDPTESEKSAVDNNVILIGKTKLYLILQHLKKGNLEEARQVIFNDRFGLS